MSSTPVRQRRNRAGSSSPASAGWKDPSSPVALQTTNPDQFEVAPPASLWLSNNPSKRRVENFFLAWTAVWIGMVAVVVGTEMYERFSNEGYMVLGLLIGLPPILYPLLFPFAEEAHLPWYARYSTKANLWIFLLAFNANYFWTHYFYRVLGATYTFSVESWRLNDVPFCLYLISHSYFLTYHVFSNIVLRRVWNAFGNRVNVGSVAVVSLVVLVMSLFVAFMETWTIQKFPYYEHADKDAMYKVGTVFYSIYFWVSFPMCLRIDERPGAGSGVALAWTFFDACACGMIITTVLDFWRLFVGPIVDTTSIPAQVPFVQ